MYPAVQPAVHDVGSASKAVHWLPSHARWHCASGDGVGVGDGERDSVVDDDGVSDRVGVTLGVRDGDVDVVGVRDGDGDSVSADGVRVGDVDSVTVAVPVAELEGDVVSDRLYDGAGVLDDADTAESCAKHTTTHTPIQTAPRSTWSSRLTVRACGFRPTMATLQSVDIYTNNWRR